MTQSALPGQDVILRS